MVYGNMRKQSDRSSPPPVLDVIVIGAGVAGLSAASRLARRGLSVLVVEARDRAGGRILSVKSAGWPSGIELGAEFIHGGNPSARQVLKEARIRTRRIESNVWWQDSGTGVLALVPDYWERIGEVADLIPSRNQGWSFKQFLRRQRGKVAAADVHLADFYVGGFDGAPTAKIAAYPLRADRAGAATEDLKIMGHYESVVRALERRAKMSGVEIRLNSPVTTVAWKRGRVAVTLQRTTRNKNVVHYARMAVVTLPLGILQSNRVKFMPVLRKKQATIARMGWGQVARIVLRFRAGFWSAPFLPKAIAAKSGRDFGFINAPGQALPVWWALHAPAPILTGWAGGEVAETLRQKSEVALLHEALCSLAGIFGTTPATVKRWLQDWKTHQWGNDPWSLGAYSYPTAGLENGAALLARPLNSTLFFAGEATADEFGTVHGALQSGLRAADEVIFAANKWSRIRPAS